MCDSMEKGWQKEGNEIFDYLCKNEKELLEHANKSLKASFSSGWNNYHLLDRFKRNFNRQENGANRDWPKYKEEDITKYRNTAFNELSEIIGKMAKNDLKTFITLRLKSSF